MTDKPQIILAPNGEELIVLTRGAYDSLVAAAGYRDDEAAEDIADAATAGAAKAAWEADGRPVIPLQVLRRVRAGDSYLKAFRAEKGLTEAQLAFQAGITRGYLSEIEASGEAPNEATREGLARALDIHPVLLSEDAPRPSEAIGG